jgi:hypothetical protein
MIHNSDSLWLSISVAWAALLLAALLLGSLFFVISNWWKTTPAWAKIAGAVSLLTASAGLRGRRPGAGDCASLSIGADVHDRGPFLGLDLKAGVDPSLHDDLAACWGFTIAAGKSSLWERSTSTSRRELIHRWCPSAIRELIDQRTGGLYTPANAIEPIVVNVIAAESDGDNIARTSRSCPPAW